MLNFEKLPRMLKKKKLKFPFNVFNLEAWVAPIKFVKKTFFVNDSSIRPFVTILLEAKILDIKY